MATQLFSNNFHSKKPNMDITLSYDVSRPDGEQSKGLQYTFYGSLYCKSGEYYYASNAVGVQISVDGVTKTFYLRGKGGGSTGEGSSLAGPWTQTECIPSDESYSQTKDYPTSYSFTTENTGSTAGITVYVWCHQGTYAEPRGGFNCSAEGGPYDYTYTGTINVPGYNPYTEPSTYAITSYTKIGRAPVGGHAGTDYSITYNLQCGSGGSIHWARCELYKEGTTWTYGKYANVEGAISGSCVYTDYVLQPNDNMWANGSRTATIKLPAENHKKYKVAIRFSDCHYQWISGDDKNIYTYTPPTEPNVKLNLNGSQYATISNVTTISPQDSASVSFTIGSRGWNDDTIEKPFTTEFKCNSYTKNDYAIANDGNNVQTSTKVVNLGATNLNTMLTNAERSNARVSTTVSVKNLNPSANWSASGSVTFNVQYQPRLAPIEGDVKYGSTSYKGKTVLIANVPKVTASWSYNHNAGAAGVVNGYTYTVYADSSKKTVMKTDNISGTSIDINTSEMNLGTLNYIEITPYYTKPDGSRLAGAQSIGFNLVKPLNKLKAPVLDYPQNGYWHNKNFRICFISSEDPDINKVTSTQGVTGETYEYNDIEVNINGTAYKYSANPEIFSRTKTGHQHHFVVNPSIISSFSLQNTYAIKVRCQKKYFADTSNDDSWSDYSATHTITYSALTDQTYTAGQEIKASHLDTVKRSILYAYNVYHTDVAFAETPVGNSIAHGTFKTYYDYIQAIKTKVNEYGAFTRNAVKFDTSNAINTIDAFKQEFITASNTVASPEGSNYFNLLEESLRNLK